MAGKRHAEADDEQELKAWRMTFRTGFDFLRALPQIGIEVEDGHRPAIDDAREAWARLGDAFLANHDDGEDPRGEPWALRTFGDPASALRPVRRPTGRRRR